MQRIANIIRDRMIGTIKYKNNIVTGEVATVNNNGTYDVYISGCDIAYPNIPTTLTEPDFAVGDAVEILVEYGNKEMPIIIGLSKKIVQDITQVGMNVIVTTLDAYSVTTTGAHLELKIEEIEGYENCTKYGFYYGTTITYGRDTYSTGSWVAGYYNKEVTGLDSGTAYHFQAYVLDADGDEHTGDDKSFTTLTVGWDLSNISYDNKSFSVTNEDDSPEAIAFKSDGTKMYMLGWTTDTIYQYSLSAAWDISTASYDTVSFPVNNEENLPVAMTFKPDGTKMYISGQHGIVYQYILSTPWDINTVSYDNKNYDVTGQNWYPYGIHFKPDGAKMYIIINSGTGEGAVYQYTLSTPWDVSTASYDSVSFSLSSNWWYDIQFKPDGTKMYAIDGTSDKVLQYSLSTAWDVSTASYDNVSNQQHFPHAMDFKTDGTKIYMLSKSTDTVYQYSL